MKQYFYIADLIDGATVRHNAKRIGAAVTNDVSPNPADGEKTSEKNLNNRNIRKYLLFSFAVRPHFTVI
jgi:hypothetical protein